MKSESKTRGLTLLGLVALAVFLLAAPGARAQAAHYLGSIAAIDGDTLTVKTDAGDVRQAKVPASAILKRIAPGEKDLAKAEPLLYSSLTVGDRVLVTLDPNFTGTPPQAARVIAIKQADVTNMHAAENAAWNQGVHGLVKSLDAASGVIVVTTRVGLTTKDVTVNTTSATVLKRYAPGSVRFDQAQPAPLAAIRPGDQLWARGSKNADGSAIAAGGVVSGSFRSIPGTVISADAAASTVTVKDLATKKPVTVRVTADAELRQLDSNVAALVAARLKGNPAGAGSHGAPNGGGGGGGNNGGQRGWNQSGAGQGRMGALKKGDAVMIVATEDASGLSAVKLLAGVEPLLEAPEAQDLLASWSLSSGESEAAQ
jgi:hypothetical protein